MTTLISEREADRECNHFGGLCSRSLRTVSGDSSGSLEGNRCVQSGLFYQITEIRNFIKYNDYKGSWKYPSFACVMAHVWENKFSVVFMTCPKSSNNE